MSEINTNADALLNALHENSEDVAKVTDGLVSDYVTWVTSIFDCTSMSEVDLLVKEHPDSLKINHWIQYFFALERKGLVLTHPGENGREYMTHPIIQQLSAKETAESLLNPNRLTPASDIVHSIAAIRVLGTVTCLLGSEQALANINTALIPDIGETIH